MQENISLDINDNSGAYVKEYQPDFNAMCGDNVTGPQNKIEFNGT